MGTAVVRVKPTVTGTAERAAILSVDCTTNETEVTCPTMAPDATAADSLVSTDVATVTSTEPAVTAPSVKPPTVITIAEADILAAAVVKTTDVAVVAPHVPVSAAMLLAPADIGEGVTPGAKKAGG
jgi:hypothetical protein